MRERTLTALLALGALLLFYLMFISDGIGPATRQARPTTVERGPDGYYALLQWLQRSGVRAASLRERYGNLLKPDAGFAASGNLLIVTLPAPQPLRTEELAALDRWLRAGNSMLVMAALCDQPEWHFGGAVSGSNVVLDLTGLQLETVEQREQRLHPRKPSDPDAQRLGLDALDAAAFKMLAKPLQLDAEPVAPHPLFDGVRNIVAFSDYKRSSWSARLPYDGFVLELARDRASGEGVLWTRLLGQGRIWISAYGSPLTNRAIASGDNARWIANLVAQSLGPAGQVIFDDMHQGITATYDGRKFYSDRRLWISVLALLLLWFGWVLGATRLRTPRLSIAAPRSADLLRAGGVLLSRRVPPSAAALRMIELALPPQRMQDAEASVAATDLERLRSLQELARGGGRVPLVELHNLLLRIDGQLR